MVVASIVVVVVVVVCMFVDLFLSLFVNLLFVGCCLLIALLAWSLLFIVELVMLTVLF